MPKRHFWAKYIKNVSNLHFFDQKVRKNSNNFSNFQIFHENFRKIQIFFKFSKNKKFKKNKKIFKKNQKIDSDR
jgi:hypothetical protein